MKKYMIRDKVISSVISSCLIISALFVSSSDRISNRVNAAEQLGKR